MMAEVLAFYLVVVATFVLVLLLAAAVLAIDAIVETVRRWVS